MGTAFTTSRGIKQGCPISPVLFALLLSGLERYLLSQAPDAGFVIAEHRRVALSYADDLTLLCKSGPELTECFGIVVRFLGLLGLSCNPSKCSYLKIGPGPASI